MKSSRDFDAFTFSGFPIWKVALAIHVTAWILQFIGHGVFEGRAPALLDSLDQVELTTRQYVQKIGFNSKINFDKLMSSSSSYCTE
jgi:uncharacterized membrane protein YGL010W